MSAEYGLADTQPRWIGVDPGDLIELAPRLERYAGYYALQLADLIADGAEPFRIQYATEDYVRARAESRRVTTVMERCYHAYALGRFAGYIVRDSDFEEDDASRRAASLSMLEKLGS